MSDFHCSKIWMTIAVNAAKEHCHGSAGAEGACGHFLWAESNRSSDTADAAADCVGEVLAFEDAPLCVVVVACNRYLCRGAATL